METTSSVTFIRTNDGKRLAAPAVSNGRAQVMPGWGAALIVGVVVAAVAGLLIYKALSALRAADPVPRRTVETLKEDAQWVKEQVK